MVTSTQRDNQAVMQLIVASSKVTTLLWQAIEAIQQNNQGQAAELLAESKQLSVKAHQIQTELIQREIRGEGVTPNLLTVHAQDHFMNSHLLLSLAEYLIEQTAQLNEVKSRLTKLEEGGV